MSLLQVAQSRKTALPIIKHKILNTRKVWQQITICQMYCVLLCELVIS